MYTLPGGYACPEVEKALAKRGSTATFDDLSGIFAITVAIIIAACLIDGVANWVLYPLLRKGGAKAEKRTDDSESVPWCQPVVHDDVHHSNASASDRELLKGMREMLRIVKNTPRVEIQEKQPSSTGPTDLIADFGGAQE